MARDVNIVVASGTAHSTPSMVSLKNNKTLCVFTLKTVEKYKLGSGAQAQHENFIRVETLGRAADKCLQEVKLGCRYLVQGYLRVDDLHGVERVRIRAYNIQDE